MTKNFMEVLSSVRDPLLQQGLETDENDDLASPGRTHRHGTTFIVRVLSLGRTPLLGRVKGLGGPRNFGHERTVWADGEWRIKRVYLSFVCFENTLLDQPTGNPT